MSIIETAYGAAVAANVCVAIHELEVATAAYQTTGTDQISATEQRDTTERQVRTREDVLTAHHSAAIEAGKNETQRRLITERVFGDDPMLTKLREELSKHRAVLYFTERQHKNAYHQMESLRVAIAGYAAVLGATR